MTVENRGASRRPHRLKLIHAVIYHAYRHTVPKLYSVQHSRKGQPDASNLLRSSAHENGAHPCLRVPRSGEGQRLGSGSRAKCQRPGAPPAGQSNSSDAQKLHLKNQGSLGRNGPGIAAVAVGQFGRDGKPRLVANPQGRHSLVPALDHLPRAQHKSEGFVAIHRTVELGAVRQPTGVMPVTVCPACAWAPFPTANFSIFMR